MSKKPFDDAAKELLQAALEDSGEVRIQHELRGSARHADVTFVPRREAKGRRVSGLLGRMVKSTCIIECYQKPPSVLEGYRCVDKRLRLWEAQQKTRPRAKLPRLWVVSAGRPRSMMGHFGFVSAEGWPRGVYRMEPARLRLMLVVVPELERERSTLMCRLLGNVSTVQLALEDLSVLPERAWEHSATLPALSMLSSLGSSRKEKVIAMCALSLYEQHRRKIIEEERARLEKSLYEQHREKIIEEERARLEKSLYEQHRQELLVGLAEQKLNRALSAAQGARLSALLGEVGPERVGQVLLEWTAEEVDRWLSE